MEKKKKNPRAFLKESKEYFPKRDMHYSSAWKNSYDRDTSLTQNNFCNCGKIYLP